MRIDRRTLGSVVGLVCLLAGIGCAGSKMTTFAKDKPIPSTLDMDYNGPRANIAVGDFDVKARGATLQIGDGLREMMETALFESERYNVLDRMDVAGLTNEQKLSYTKLASPDAPKLGGKMDVAELLVYGTVSEFEAEAMGAGARSSISEKDMPETANWGTYDAGVGGKVAHMAIDVRVVDTKTGRVVAARRIAGSAASGEATLAWRTKGKYKTPISLGAYANTPMELAIRDCIYRSVIYMCSYLPEKYFQY